MSIMHKLEYARRRVDKIIDEFSASYMSNPKWVKLCDAVSAFDIGGLIGTVKLVWDPDCRGIRIDKDLEYKFDYYDTAMEGMVAGYPSGWYDYKEIEWLRFEGEKQLLELVRDAVNCVGQFEFVVTPRTLTLLAYKST